mgnify:CR=1 FL=1
MFNLSLCIIFCLIVVNTALLAFAYRDFSFSLLGMFILSVIGLPLSSYFLFKKEPDFLIISSEEEEAEEFQLEGRFCLNHYDLK